MARYYLRFCGNPLCDFMGCQAGRMLCAEADITACSYRTVKDARAARRRIEKAQGGGWTGSVSIHEGDCPRTREA